MDKNKPNSDTVLKPVKMTSPPPTEEQDIRGVKISQKIRGC